MPTAFELHSAIFSAWVASGLNGHFQEYWPETANATHTNVVLHDMEAVPGTPFPYCVFESDESTVAERMTGSRIDQNREIRDIRFTFNVHAKLHTTTAKSPKTIAAELVDKIMQVFGGHHAVKPEPLTLTNGNVLQVQYESDWGVRTGDDEYQWVVQYAFRLDVPVAV